MLFFGTPGTVEIYVANTSSLHSIWLYFKLFEIYFSILAFRFKRSPSVHRKMTCLLYADQRLTSRLTAQEMRGKKSFSLQRRTQIFENVSVEFCSISL